MRDIRVAPLPPQAVPQAYPLIQAAMPELDLDAWNSYAHSLLQPASNGDARQGILAAYNEGNFIVGLAVYRALAELRHGPALLIEHLLAFDLLDRKLIARRLLDELEALASGLGCTALHVTLPNDQERGETWLMTLLQGSGHRIEGLSLCKCLA